MARMVGNGGTNMAENRITFEQYVEHMIAANEKDPEPSRTFMKNEDNNDRN